MDVMTAAINVVHDYPGGAHALGPRIGKAPSSLSHELSPHCGHAKLGLVDAVKISVISGDTRIASAFAAELGCLLLPVAANAGGHADTLSAVAALAREFSDVVTQAGETMADGVVTANELQRVETEAGQLVAAVQQVLGVLRAVHEQGRGAGASLRAVA